MDSLSSTNVYVPRVVREPGPGLARAGTRRYLAARWAWMASQSR